MTKPNLDEKRDALAEAHANPQGVWDYADGQQVADFVAGWDAALEALREVPGEFDVGLADQDAHEWAKEHVHAIKNLDGSALWKHGFTRGAQAQFERDKERIAALTAVCDAQVVTLVELNERVAELTEAIVFSLRGLQMWRTYQSPGNIAEVEQRLRQALKRDGGSDE